MGNREAKELMCVAHGHELRWRNDGGREGTGRKKIKGRKQLCNCNSIINKIYSKISELKNNNVMLIYWTTQME